MQQGKWVALSETARLAAREQLPQPVAALSAEAARILHDAALLCSMLGHLPPVRLYVLITSGHPDYSGRCQDEACLSPGTCPGNRLTWVDTVERSKLKVQWEQVVSAAFCRLAVPATCRRPSRLCLGCSWFPSTLVRLHEAGLQGRLCCSRPHVHACPEGPNHTTAVMCACKGLP